MHRQRHTAREENPVEVAGLAVQAADTGRVLMIQRSYADKKDPARGTWEFPGGHLEEGESPAGAAAREWAEEVGCETPHGDITASWRSGPIYQGFVMVVQTEAEVPVNLQKREVKNPDDPDGDDFETCAWMEPRHIPGMPNLRKEVKRGTDWRVFRRAWRERTAVERSDYGMAHSGPDAEGGSPAHALDHGAYPSDVYTHPHYYDDGQGGKESIDQLRAARGKPDHPVTIYRALPHPHRSINTGDWVTTSSQYADEHAKNGDPHGDGSGDWPVIRATVPARHLHTDGNSLHEFAYNGPSIEHAELHHPGGLRSQGRRTARLDADWTKPADPAYRWAPPPLRSTDGHDVSNWGDAAGHGQYNQTTWVHHRDTGEPIAHISTGITDSDDGSHKEHHVHMMEVEPQHRGQGHMTRLVDHYKAHEMAPGDTLHWGMQTPEGAAWIGKHGAWADSPEQHWRPTERIFGTTKADLDPRLFTPEDRLRPEVREFIVATIDGFWGSRYGDWRSWASVFFSGSEASHWWGNGDFDVLVGMRYDTFARENPNWRGLSHTQVEAALNDELHRDLWPRTDQSYITLADGQVTGPWGVTVYVNHEAYDIRRIKPYAAYDVMADAWVVKPPLLGVPHQYSDRFWQHAEDVADQIRFIQTLPPAQQAHAGQVLWDVIHHDRSRAFSDRGYGWDDPGNALEKYLDQSGLLPLLLEWKHAGDQSFGRTAKLPRTQKCEWCKQRATKRVLWAEGMAYVPTCDDHLDRTKRHVSQGGMYDGVSAVHDIEKAASASDMGPCTHEMDGGGECGAHGRWYYGGTFRCQRHRDDFPSKRASSETYWHGTPYGDVGERPGETGVHVGTKHAAREALNARIGHRADGGDWDGTSEYGKTMIAGRKTLSALGRYPTGYSASRDFPEEDHLPDPARTTRGLGAPATARPHMFPVRITGPMANTPATPHKDFAANGRMKSLINRGQARKGYFYRNEAEDEGSISAVVPSWDHLARVEHKTASRTETPCACCGGTGEHHATMAECYRCDGCGDEHEATADHPLPCAGAYPVDRAGRTLDGHGHPVEYDAQDGWQHRDGSVSHDDGSSVSESMRVVEPNGGMLAAGYDDPTEWAEDGHPSHREARVEHVRPSELAPHVRDLDSPHDRRKVQTLMESIAEHGYDPEGHGGLIEPPIRASRTGDGWAISNGHHRLRAMDTLGYDHPVPVEVS